MRNRCYSRAIARVTTPLPEGLELSRVDVPAYIETTIAMYERFMALFGGGAPAWGFDVIGRTILAAKGRLKVDQNLSLTVHELAAMSQVVPKRVQNAIYAGSDQAPVLDAQGLVTRASASHWLAARAYMPSLWQDHTAGRDNGVDEPGSTEHEDSDFLFVPEASDGSLFTPGHSARVREGEPHFMIGDKGAERSVVGYEHALAELTRMATPRWRRRNSNGNWGIVRAERWRRIRRSDVERL